MKFEDAMKLATPLPWPEEWQKPENPDGTTCSESNANSRLQRHCTNHFNEVVDGLAAAMELLQNPEKYEGIAHDFTVRNLHDLLNKAKEVKS